MELGLFQKRVFITASTGGIGNAIARKFLEEDAKVVINGRDPKKTDAVLWNLRNEYGTEKVSAVCADMSEETQIERAISEIQNMFSCVDVVVGNLGTGKPISDDRFDSEEWVHMLRMNLLSAVKLVGHTRHCFPEMGGSIVLTASLAGHERIGAPPAYAASKAGLLSFVKYAAPILVDDRIRINAVSPGNVFFEGGRWEKLKAENPRSVNSYIKSEVPMKRFGRAEEIAETVLFLASERSSFTTGTVVEVDGGQGRSI